MVGGGLVGLACSWWLIRRGHQVLLLDPGVATGAIRSKTTTSSEVLLSGSRAALGILMAQVFHRSSGRGWRLRQHSLALWSEWRLDLEQRGHGIPWRPGLLLLAADADQLERQRRLVLERQPLGLPLELWGRQRLAGLRPALPDQAVGGLYSPADGQLDPAVAVDALRRDAEQFGLTSLLDAAAALEPRPMRQGGWRVALSNGGAVEAPWVVLAAGVACADLLVGLEGAGDWPLEPVLGQAMELELPQGFWPEAGPSPGWAWPGAVGWQGVHLVPRPDLPGGRRFWLGATLEPGVLADPAALGRLRDLAGTAPEWLRQARLIRQWQGVRPRPVGRPAPLLEAIAPGLLLVGGHYRNGVLLAPATAMWVAERIEAQQR